MKKVRFLKGLVLIWVLLWIGNNFGMERDQDAERTKELIKERTPVIENFVDAHRELRGVRSYINKMEHNIISKLFEKCAIDDEETKNNIAKYISEVKILRGYKIEEEAKRDVKIERKEKEKEQLKRSYEAWERQDAEAQAREQARIKALPLHYRMYYGLRRALGYSS